MTILFAQAALNSFIEILKQFLKGFPLSRTPGYRWNISPIAALFRFMDNNFKFHGTNPIDDLTALQHLGLAAQRHIRNQHAMIRTDIVTVDIRCDWQHATRAPHIIDPNKWKR